MLLAACAPAAPAPAAAPAAVQPAATAAPAPAAPELTPEVRRLIQAARDNGETELGLSWSLSSLGGVEAAKRWEALMNQTYGTNIKINLSPGVSMPDMGVKLTQEYVAGQKASTSVYLALEHSFAGLLPRGVLEEYDYTQLSPRLTREIVAEGNVGVEVYGTIPTIMYNTELVPREEAPRRLEDVLQPKWKGLIAGAETASYLDRVSLRPEWGVERMRSFVTRFADQIGGVIRQSEDHRIISGEFRMFVLSNTHSVRERLAQGAPVASQIPQDVATIGTLHLGVPRNAAQPNLAKLYINTVMSEAGQRILYETYHADHWALPGSQSGAELRELQAQGIEIQKVNVKFILDHPELAGLAREFSTIMREKRGS
jgi:iron(III) transport system substrate-binding protein